MPPLLRERYEPLAVVAEGGQGRVLQALDHVHGRHVALKERWLGPLTDREALLREARILFTLVPHPGVTLVRDDFFDGDRYYLVMDWVDGPTLAGVLEQDGGPGLPLDRVAEVVGQVAAALDHCHAHDPPILHGDVKPANVVLTKDGRAVLVDFGIAGAPGRDGARAGTRGFVAPEVRAGLPLAPSSDVYGLAATAFALLTGDRPGAGRAPVLDLPAGEAERVRQALEAGLAVDPAKRTPTARAFHTVLRPSAAAPTGRVTFLLTDVEGSTRQWEADPEAMARAIARHDELVAHAAEQHRGVRPVTQGEGDSALLVFARAAQAVACALDLQRAFVAEPWPPGAPIRVRMALHTGEAELREGNYFGVEVNRCARLRATAHGGQTVVTGAAAKLLRDDLPAGAALRDLGVHGLKDITQPERVFELRHADLTVAFPPLRSLDVPTHNLPVQLTSFVGRDEEREDVAALVRSRRLVTLTGTGGVGKTRLAIEVGRELVESFPDGVWLVDFAPLDDPRLVPAAVADVFRLREEGRRSLTDTLVSHLEARALMLLMDNCEHLVDSSAELIHLLLRRCPRLKVVVTSRRPLGVSGELAHRVRSLGLPARGASLQDGEATRLFCERASLTVTGFSPAGEEAEAVIRICRELDGIPLAIELAAARVSALPPREIAGRLDDRFRLLRPGAGPTAQRQRTLEQVVEWSYGLLEPAERLVLDRLSVFRGGFTLEGAEEVSGGDGIERADVVSLLTSLADSSLVDADRRGDYMRYRLLETIRLYAARRVEDSGDAGRVRTRHLRAFLALAELADAGEVGPQQALWLDTLEVEHDNLRSALAAGRGSEEGLRLASALIRFWSIRGHWTEGRRVLEEFITEAGDGEAALRECRLGAAYLAASLGDYDAAGVHVEEGIELAREAGDHSRSARLLNQSGELARLRGDHVEAKARYGEALELARWARDTRVTAQVLTNMGVLARVTRDLDLATRSHEEALDLFHEAGDACEAAKVLNNLGLVEKERGDYAAAARLFDEALTAFAELRYRQGEAEALQNRGLVSLALEEDPRTVRSLWERSLAIFEELGFRRGCAQVLVNLGTLADMQRDPDEAERCAAAAVALWRRMGDRRMAAKSLLGLAHAAVEYGDERKARTRCASALRVALAAECAAEAADALGLLAGLVAAAGRAEEAVGLCAAGSGRGLHLDPEVTARLRATLGDDAFEHAWRLGTTTSLDSLADAGASDQGAAMDTSPR